MTSDFDNTFFFFIKCDLCYPQSETSVLKSRLTIAESKNFTLEKEKGELEGAIKSLKSSVRSESGENCNNLTRGVLLILSSPK